LPRQGGVVLGRALRLRHGLPGLALGGNDLGDLGAAARGGAVAGGANNGANNMRLSMLDLSNNSVGFEGFEKLCEGLKCGGGIGLMVLKLGGNNLGAKGGRLLANLLKSRRYQLSSSLEELNLSSTNIGV